MKFSILIPVYNERYLVAELVRRVLAAPLPHQLSRELIIVDDGSTDGTREVLHTLAAQHPQTIRCIEHPRNMGKGAAIRTAIDAATGEFAVFQDADLEYDPNDYCKLLAPLLSGHADVVYGSRFLTAERRRVLYFWHSLGNNLLTMMSNMFTDLNLTDMETCYKAFRTQILKSIPIRCNGFGIEPEITAKVAKRGLRIYEVPINYDGRTYGEGKKITWRDGYRALFVILKYWLIDDIYEEKTGHDNLSSLSKAHRFNKWMAESVIRPYIGARVLEIGSGIGNIAVQLMPRDRYVTSDFDDLHLDVLKSMALRRPNVEARRIDAQDPQHFKDLHNQFDSVVCINVLEHIPDSHAALRNIYDALEPGGRVVVLVPQGQWLYSPMDRAVEHVKRYSKKELAEALAQTGFEVEHMLNFNRIGIIGWTLNSKILRRSKMAKYQLKMYDSLVWLWRRIDWLLPWHGLSLIGVARKPEIPKVLVGPSSAAKLPAPKEAILRG